MKQYQYQEVERALMERSPIPFSVCQLLDDRVVTLVVSAGFCSLFGCAREEAYARMEGGVYGGVHPDDGARLADELRRFAAEGGAYNVILRAPAEGRYRIIRARGERTRGEDGTPLIVVRYEDEGGCGSGPEDSADEADRRFGGLLCGEAGARNAHLDQLTGLPGMSYYFGLAESGRRRIREEGARPAFLFIDLSGMKYFNQKFGFSEGDRLLCGFAGVLTRHFGSESCSRFGQDHFAVLTRADGLEDALEEIFREAAELNGGKALPVRVGVYLDREDEEDEEDAAYAFDKASYACDDLKGAYGSCFVYYQDSMLSSAEDRQYIIDNIDRALEEKWIKVYYQPIIRAANGRVCDEEALARWLDPEKGLLSPAAFIPVLEEARLIYKLDLYVLEEILAKLKRQKAAGLYIVPQSLNLSRADFDAGDIVEEIRRRVDAAGIAREMVTIEVTESVVGSDFDFMKEQICRFRDLGFPVWMDDFGSGYSSLDVLQNIRFDLIKFDMRFMQQFDQGDQSKIILTELIKMTIALGVDTVTEGVETAEQAEFLKEVGCTKLQGYYFCKPISMEELLERYRTGVQIGFEDPEETGYYAAIGRINLYDLAVLIHNGQDSLGRYFNTIPMAIYESWDDRFRVTRCNSSYRDYMRQTFGVELTDAEFEYAQTRNSPAAPFFDAMLKCRGDGEPVLIDEETGNGSDTQALIKRIAVSPVTGTTALVVAVLAVTDHRDAPIRYTNIAQALSADYINLYYVDLDTERFVTYRPTSDREDLAAERRGENFFRTSREEARQLLHEADQEIFFSAFTKENVVRALDDHGSFTLTYRQRIGDAFHYASMKAVRMGRGDSHIIIGVNDVDAQMKQQEALERIKKEQLAYARLTALSDRYICMYSVEPETEHFIVISATGDYAGLGLAGKGTDFFATSRRESRNAICQEDLEMFDAVFTKENVLEEIRRSGRFTMNYRLLIDGKPTRVNLKAAMVEEENGPLLIIGVTSLEGQESRG